MTSRHLFSACFTIAAVALAATSCSKDTTGSNGGKGGAGGLGGGTTSTTTDMGVGGCGAEADLDTCSCDCGGTTVVQTVCGPACFAVEGRPCGDGGGTTYAQCVVTSSVTCGCGA